METRAAVAHKAGEPLRIETVNLDGPGAGEVLVELKATGVCHTDEFTLSGADPEGLFPAILGHEGAGVVVEVGDGVSSVKPGDHVIPLYTPECRQCEYCLSGKTNLCHNCVDRQVIHGHGDETAIIWEGEPMAGGKPEIRRLTYRDLQRDTTCFGNALKKLGVKKGDVVTIYMGMVPELATAMLACARIGAVHSVIFGGFSAQAIRDRVEDARSRIVITADGGWRRGKVVELKNNVDEAAKATDLVEHVVVLS